MRHLATCLIAAVFTASLAGQARAQDSTTGAIRGLVTDSGAPVIGATIIATSPAMQGQQAGISDERGSYFITSLPPGTYLLTVYYLEGEWSRKNVIVAVGKTVPVNISVTAAAGAELKGEVIELETRAPMLDQGSTKRGVTITEDYARNIPTGQTFAGTLGAAAGAQGDTYGVSFGGSTSPENVYIVNGLNTTDPLAGLIDTNLPNEFIYQTEVITSGYQAEYGRSTGAVVNVVTKTGSNEFHGQVYSYFTPGALRATPTPIKREGSAISTETDPVFLTSFGAEVGGPIVKDKVWFHVGFNPEVSFTDVDRVVSRNVDGNADEMPDVDPKTGFSVLEEVQRTTRKQQATRYFLTGTTNFAVAPEHQGALSFFGNPRSREAFVSHTGPVETGLVDIQDGTYDFSAKWTSKFNNNQQQIDVVIGTHAGRYLQSPAYVEGDQALSRIDYAVPLSNYEIVPGCDDSSPMDPYPGIENCSVRFYRQGGVGFVERRDSSRLAGGASFTHRGNAVGHHVVKGGLDFENNGLDSFREYTDGELRIHRSGYTQIRRYYTVGSSGGPNDEPCGADLNGDGVPDERCAPTDILCGADIDGDGQPDAVCSLQQDGLTANTRTFNLGAYLQDSWAIMPNLTFNGGIRWEQQTLYAADHVVGEISPTTGEPIPSEAFKLGNMIAPRLGVIYDWSKEGRSKAYAHAGRFYESIPMDINDRAYGGEVLDLQYISPCSNPSDPATCDYDSELFRFSLGGGELVAPGIKAQYLDELIVGVEYEFIENLSLGVAFIHRGLGRVIEDVSSDGGETYVIANPGEIDQGAIDRLRAEAAQIMSTNPDPSTPAGQAALGRANFLAFQAENYEKVKGFDKPSRTYNGVELMATKRFSDNFFMQASYTISKTKGNFPGLFSPDTGQLDPNLTSMYDLPDLMANRYGSLPQDAPHQVKVDGYYAYDDAAIGRMVFGGRFRASSGRPHNYLGAHSVYGTGEAFVLPRDSAPRSPITTNVDVHVAYGRVLSKGVRMEGFVDFFNLFNQQPEVDVDENYTYDSVNPIVGGDTEDVKHLKSLDPDSGLPTAKLAEENPNFLNTTSRQSPFGMRLGLRLIF